MANTTHMLKLSKEFANSVLNGDKCFEVRKNDRGFQKGDNVIFQVVDSYELGVYHKLNDKVFEITYVLGGWGIENGYVVFGIKERDDNG